MMATQKGALGLDAPVDLDAPSLSRIYDYLLGGGHDFAADRVVADQIAALVPGYGVFIRENGTFRRRAVLHMLPAGIEQFLDVGTGVFSTDPCITSRRPETPTLTSSTSTVIPWSSPVSTSLSSRATREPGWSRQTCGTWTRSSTTP
jgi:hypothetical protein